MQPIMVDANGLQVSAAGNPLLHGVTLSVAAGEHVALVGANGAGKSTLLRALSGFCKVTSGSLSVHGMQLDGHHRRRGLPCGACAAASGRCIKAFIWSIA